MRDTLKPGATMTRTLVVDRPRTIDFLGDELRVYATPELVRDFEITCRDLLLQHCDPNEDSVGVGISVTHGGATLIGMPVEIAVEVAAVDGRMVKFKLSARDGVEPVSQGEHTRAVVDVAKLRARVQAKAAKARSA
jgi:fluoroacetyl-CoA thioesterase